MVLIPLVERLGRRVLKGGGFRSRFVRTRVGAIHVYEANGTGDLPTILVLHGLSSAASAFVPILLRLRRHARRVVAVEYPGHGFSEAPSVKLTPEVLYEAVFAALDEVVPEPAIVVGNSLGGGVALHLAVERPERVLALALLSPAGSRTTDEEWQRIRDVFTIQTRADARRFLDTIYHRTPYVARLLAHEMPEALSRAAIRDLLATATNDHAPTPEALAQLKMPILFLWGRSERLFSQHQLDYFRQNLPPHTVVEEPEGFGHCPHFDAPSELTRRIVSFARGAAEARG